MRAPRTSSHMRSLGMHGSRRSRAVWPSGCCPAHLDRVGFAGPRTTRPWPRIRGCGRLRPCRLVLVGHHCGQPRSASADGCPPVAVPLAHGVLVEVPEPALLVGCFGGVRSSRAACTTPPGICSDSLVSWPISARVMSVRPLRVMRGGRSV
jgi:hypothetical protein